MPEMRQSESGNPLNMTRSEKWAYIIGSLLGGLSDAGIVRWLAVWQGTDQEGDLDAMFAEAVKLRDGMIAT